MVINHMCLLNYPSKSYKPLILIYFFYYYFSINALIIYLLSLSKKTFLLVLFSVPREERHQGPPKGAFQLQYQSLHWRLSQTYRTKV